MGPGLEITEGKHVVWFVERVDRRRWRIHIEAEHRPELHGALVQEQVGAVQVNRDAEDLLGAMDAGDVIDVRMGQQNAVEADRTAPGPREQRLHLVSGIDQHSLVRTRARHDESVLEERTDGGALDYDHGVILAILDDLMFTSKIRTTAKQLGVRVSIARSRESALADMRAERPSLVILDLNNPRTDPIGTVAAMKADPDLSVIATVGFSHHTQTETMAAARRAGVGEVLARGAFFERLPDFLTRAS